MGLPTQSPTQKQSILVILEETHREHVSEIKEKEGEDKLNRATKVFTNFTAIISSTQAPLFRLAFDTYSTYCTCTRVHKCV